MAASGDRWNVYEYYNPPYINYLGSFEIYEDEQSTLSTKLSEAGISIPQGAIGIYYHGSIIGFNDIVPFISGVSDVDTAFAYLQQPETITGFFLDGTEYKIGGDEAAWGNISGTLSDQTDLNTALSGKADKTEVLSKNNTTAFTPTNDYNPATKKYVDDNAGTEYHSGEGISIEEGQVTARKGPSPDGFHVPSITEWQGVKTIMDGLSLTTGNSWKINLHIPIAGYREHPDTSPIYQRSQGYYWSSSPRSSRARNLYLDSSIVSTDGNNYRASGVSVRCFKDSYTTPDSNWTVAQGTLGNAGIFWNQSEGLISITDGSTGYTIMDKNLGATTVYNDGDTLSEANCGKYYQWGNNYGFAWTGSVITSSTQVDASTYGPTNPYSSDTFIIGNSDWSSVQNNDLWGDTTGTITQENVISNTGVLSVNGHTGDVTIDTISKVPTTQPSNPELGSIYFDTSIGAIMVYDGTEWKKAGGSSGGDVKLDPIDDLTAVKGNAKVTLTWTDPDNVIIDGHTFAAWASTKLVRKAGSAPTSLSDGTLVTTSTTKNQYSSTGYVDSGLVGGTTYYYAAFAISEAGNETISNIASAKPIVYQTYTVSWTEASDPTSWVNTYSDNAAGMTQGSDDFDEFIGYSAVLLDDSGNEVAEVTQAESGGNGKLNISLLQAKGIIDGSNSSTNNVMIKFPLRGVKMTKSGSTVTLSITDEPDKSGYQYYAFNDNGTTKDALYLGAYKGSSIDSKLRSISGTSSIGKFSLDSSVAAANAHSSSRYHEESWYARCLINAYYKLKYANPNSQSVIGMGYVGGKSAQTTGATNSITTATGATDTSNTGRIKLFGLEDRWGNVWEWMDGAYYSSGTNLQTSSTGAFSNSSRITSFDKNVTVTSGWMSSILGTNDGMFAGNGASGGTSTYYCDSFYAASGDSLLAGGNRYVGDYAGAFHVYNNGAGYSNTYDGSRLMFL